jgi:small subunit ribosomal protein S14
MAGAAQKADALKKSRRLTMGRLKHSTKAYTRCQICGRSRGYIGRFKMCRICFRNLAMKGELPGVQKASW